MNCPGCEKTQHEFVRESGRFKIWVCAYCELQFADPLLYEDSDYDESYRSAQGEFFVPPLDWLRQASPDLREYGSFLSSAQDEALVWIRDHLPPGAPVLDIGCGSGWFLGALRASGYQPFGIDVANAPLTVLRERGFAVATGHLDQIPSDWPLPGVVTLFEVLEHLPDPVGVLRDIRRRFPGVPIILSVPSPKRWTRLGGSEDLADLAPNHLTWWNPRSLQYALERAGYHGVQTQLSKPTGMEVASVGLRSLFSTALTKNAPVSDDRGQLRPLRSEIVVRSCKSVVVGWPLAGLFRAQGKSGLYLSAIAQ